MRKLDHDQLMFWLANNENGMVLLSTLTGIGFYTIRRIVQKKREPKKFEQLALVQATGLSLDTLFPVYEAEKESA